MIPSHGRKGILMEPRSVTTTSDFAIDISHGAEPPTSHLVLSEAQDHHWKIRLRDAFKLHLRPDGKTNGK